MREFGLSLAGLSLVSSVGSFAGGESAILNERDKALIDENYIAIEDSVKAIANLFKENNSQSVAERGKELIEKFQGYKYANKKKE